MIRERTTSPLNKMVSLLIDGLINQRKVIHPLKGLKRWLCQSRELPRKVNTLASDFGEFGEVP